jgi:hypothetical protein
MLAVNGEGLCMRMGLRTKSARTKKGDRRKVPVGFDGRFEVGARKIEDPLEKGQRYYAAANVRESAIDHLASRNRINTAQAAAGDRFRKLWESAAIGAVKGLDPAKDVVDGGPGALDPLTDQVARASKELADAIEALGPVDSRIMLAIMEEGSIEKAAAKWSRITGVLKGRRAEGYIAGSLVDCLNALVQHWRLEGIGKPKTESGHYLRKGQRVAVYDDIVASGPIDDSGPSYEITVGRFGDMQRQEIRPIDKGPLMRHVAGSAEGASTRRMRDRAPQKS